MFYPGAPLESRKQDLVRRLAGRRAGKGWNRGAGGYRVGRVPGFFGMGQPPFAQAGGPIGGNPFPDAGGAGAGGIGGGPAEIDLPPFPGEIGFGPPGGDGGFINPPPPPNPFPFINPPPGPGPGPSPIVPPGSFGPPPSINPVLPPGWINPPPILPPGYINPGWF